MTTLPCMGKKGTALFQITADGAYENIPEEVFLRRHYPLQMRRDNIPYTEEQLLDELLYPTGREQGTYTGNRVWFLYGAPGSGKSEASKWLSIRLQQLAPGRPVIRITKDELDTMRVLDRLQKEIGGAGFDVEVTQRWLQFRKMTRTLAEFLVAQAALNVMPHDPPSDLKNRLVDAVNKHLGVMFQRMEHAELGDDWVPQLIGTEEWELIRQSASSSEFESGWDPNLLHAELIRAWHMIVHGQEIDWGATLQKFSDGLPLGVRPILMIDDVMRALNIFAIELLEAFLNHFDSGSWDVLVGVTPGALEQTFQGQQLYNRIQTGTYGQRITHLRLTSDTGRESYFITQENAPEFLAKYMSEYKDMNGWSCNPECSHYAQCYALQCGEAADARLTPFTPSLVRRLYRSIPDQEGKARALVKSTGKILSEWAKSQIDPGLLTQYRVSPTFYPEMADEYDHLRPYLQLFGPQPPGAGLLVIPDQFWAFFDLAGPSAVDITAVTQFDSDDSVGPIPTGPALPPKVPELPPPNESEIIRWLDRQTNNAQLLQPLREGVNKVVQRVVEPHVLTRSHVLTSKGSLTYRETFLSQVPPVRLELADEPGEGVQVPVALRASAFALASYGHQSTPEKADRALGIAELPSILYSATDLRAQYRMRVEGALKGRSLSGFALDLMILLVGLHGPFNPTPELLTKAIPYVKESAHSFPDELRALQPLISAPLQETIHQFFKDTYLLREDLFDGYLLELELERCGDVQSLLKRLDEIDTQSLPEQVYLGLSKSSSQKLKDVLVGVKEGPVKALARLAEAPLAQEAFRRYSRNAAALADVTPERIGTWQAFFKRVAKSIPYLASTIGKVTEFDLSRLPDHKQKAKEISRQVSRLLGETGKPTSSLALANILCLVGDIARNPLYRLIDTTYDLLDKVKGHAISEIGRQAELLVQTGVPALSADLLGLAVLARASSLVSQLPGPNQQGLAEHFRALGHDVQVTTYGLFISDGAGGTWVVDYRPDYKRGLTSTVLRRVVGDHGTAMQQGAKVILWVGCSLDSAVKQFVQQQYPGKLAIFGGAAFGSGKVLDGIGDGVVLELAAMFLAQLGASWRAEYESLRFQESDSSTVTSANSSSIGGLFQDAKKAFEQYEQVDNNTKLLNNLARAVSASHMKSALWAPALESAVTGNTSQTDEVSTELLKVARYLAELRIVSLDSAIRTGIDMVQTLQEVTTRCREQSIRQNSIEIWRNRLENLRAVLTWDIFAPLVPLPKQELDRFLTQFDDLAYDRPDQLQFTSEWLAVKDRLAVQKADGNLLDRLKQQFQLTTVEAHLLDAAFLQQRGVSLRQVDSTVVDNLEVKLPGIKDALVVVAKTAVTKRSSGSAVPPARTPPDLPSSCANE